MPDAYEDDEGRIQGDKKIALIKQMKYTEEVKEKTEEELVMETKLGYSGVANKRQKKDDDDTY